MYIKHKRDIEEKLNNIISNCITYNMLDTHNKIQRELNILMKNNILYAYFIIFDINKKIIIRYKISKATDTEEYKYEDIKRRRKEKLEKIICN